MTDKTVDPIIRQIEDQDLPQVIDLLLESFPRRDRPYWIAGFERLGARPVVAEQPRYGYVLDDDGVCGVVLAISSRHGKPGEEQIFNNISSWCVAPSHRGPAAKQLYAHAASAPNITHTNLSAASHTLKTITKFDFEEWTAGQLVGIGRGKSSGFGGIVQIEDLSAGEVSDREMALLQDHQDMGCIAFCLRIGDRLVPMIFLRRKIQRIVPCAQLIYCADRSDFLAHSRSINFYLARRGCPFLIFDANGPVLEVLGRYYPGKAAKYYKGDKPQLDVDHTYSEMVYLRF